VVVVLVPAAAVVAAVLSSYGMQRPTAPKV
jgi:hypothetical protein